ncbi:MAG: potassium channel family protein [Dokdonella sp.]
MNAEPVVALYQNWTANVLVVSATFVAVAAVVLLHYEGLVAMSGRLARRSSQRRRKVLFAITAILVLHITEIWIFGVTCWLLLMWPACGHIVGSETLHLFDAVYLSAVTYSTVGFGDLAPVGVVRFLIGTESLVGFVLITWSASFTYLEMAHFWDKLGSDKRH